MTRFLMFLTTGILASPTLALAAEHSAGYRGIGYIYFSFIAAVLIYGVYDSFGKTAMGPNVRLSADPSAMAAACALRAGQIAQERGRRSFAREMFQMIVTNFPQPRYRYYVVQAREGLERLDAEPSG